MIHSPVSSVQSPPPWLQAGGLRGPCAEEAHRLFLSLLYPYPPQCHQSTSPQAILSQAHGQLSHPGMSACKPCALPNPQQTRPLRPTLLPRRQILQCARSHWTSQMTRKPGRWRSGHSSMHPPTQPLRLRRSNAMSSSSSCARGRGAACVAPPAAYNAAPEQGKQAVSLLRASCGARLGAASFAITCTDPLVPCRRQGCLLARAPKKQDRVSFQHALLPACSCTAPPLRFAPLMCAPGLCSLGVLASLLARSSPQPFFPSSSVSRHLGCHELCNMDAPSDLDTREGLVSLMQTLQVPVPLQDALLNSGIVCIADFAYASAVARLRRTLDKCKAQASTLEASSAPAPASKHARCKQRMGRARSAPLGLGGSPTHASKLPGKLPGRALRRRRPAQHPLAQPGAPVVHP